MRDPNRILIIVSKLMTAWTAAPDLRLGQLISNAHARIMGNSAELFYVEDEFLSAGLDDIIAAQNPREITRLRADVKRIGHERDQMVATKIAQRDKDVVALRDWGGWAGLNMPSRYVERNKIANDGISAMREDA